MRLSIGEISRAVNGEQSGGDSESVAEDVSIDTRTIKSGELFFALKGPRFDGHNFVDEAFKKGSLAAVVQRPGGFASPPPPPGRVLITVEDTLKALGDLAAYVRKKTLVPLIAITGTAGKTTTKEMAASILSKRQVLKTPGNKNNLVGMPLTLIGLNPGHKAAVIELGISEEDEMARMAEISSPDVALITNIGRGHLEGLETVEKVAKEKGKLFYAVAGSGVMVVNLDDPLTKKMAEEIMEECPVTEQVTYGTDPEADVHVKGYSGCGLEGFDVDYEVKGMPVTVRLKVPGEVNVVNAAAAIASTLPLGVSIEEITEGLEDFTATPGRMDVFTEDGITMIDDSYNSNPESLLAALSLLSEADGRKIAVLGDMLELGEDSSEAHIEAGKEAAEMGVDLLVAIGGFADEVAEGACNCQSSQGPTETYKCEDMGEAVEILDGLLREGDTVLVKGSRGTSMEGLVCWFRAEHGNS